MKKLFTALALSLTFLSVSAQTTEKKPTVSVTGEVTKPLTLTQEDLSKMKRTDAMLKDRDGKQYRYTGVPIYEILKQAGATVGKQLHGENLAKYLLVKAADGYQVLFSLAELDSSFTDRVVILADQMEGGPIPSGKGPFRIIIPGERKPARCAFEVSQLIVGFAKE